MRSTLVLFSLLFFITACSSSLPHRYDCEDNQEFDAMITSDVALIRFKDEQFEIPRIRSASGMQFENNKNKNKKKGLYVKGDEAILVIDNIELKQCKILK